jgi:nitroreductase
VRPLAVLTARKFRDFAAWTRGVLEFGPAAFFLGSPNIAREHQATTAGTRQFRRARGHAMSSDYVLRRGVHRLEKGLISRPRKATFATDYIEEVVSHLAEAAAASGGVIEPNSEAAWAHDVLTEYFSVAGGAPEIDRARTAFLGIGASRDSTGQLLTPYERDLGAHTPVTYAALRELAVRRRSVRWFEDRPVPRELVDAAILVACQAPSACNRQPFEFLVFDEVDEAHRVAMLPGGADGFAWNVPVTVVVVGKLDAFFSDRDRHLIYIDGALAAMGFMLALETLGLSSCAINTPGVEASERRLAAHLGLAPFERPVMLIAVGYPDPSGKVPRSQKKSLDALRRYVP